jgi:hypothetical protein
MRQAILIGWLVFCGCSSGAGPAPDAGPGPDGGLAQDGGVAQDGGAPQDGGAAQDGGGLPAGSCDGDYANCTSFTDLPDGGTISFTCCAYSPKCVRIRAGQSLRFNGTFGDHPLAQACGPADVIANAPGPYTFTAPGRYGFYCLAHGTESGTGMAGAIDVVP